MDRFEKDLRNALQRQEPSPDFTQRVLDTTAHQTWPKQQGRKWRLFGSRWSVAAAMLLIILSAVVIYRREQQRSVDGERARGQAMLALRIVGTQLQLVEAKLQDLGRNSSEGDQ